MIDRKIRLASTFSEVQQNIEFYDRTIANSPELQARAGYARAWYVERQKSRWLFAPSKFVGYRVASVADYLRESGSSGQRDGRETERLLEQWYEAIDPESGLGRELFVALRSFLAPFRQKPNRLARINRPKMGWEIDVADQGSGAATSEALLDRITVDPAICGGQPIIRGTRMRVGDIVEMMAHGATSNQILADFDYLIEADVSAALVYAARSSRHRTIRAA